MILRKKTVIFKYFSYFLRYMQELDKKDLIILGLLQKNCRMKLTAIAKEANLSVDSVKKRIEKMIKNKIFYPRIQLRPRNFGFANILTVNMRLQYSSEEEFLRFIAYLKSHPNVVEIIQTAGEWDLFIVVISKDAIEFGKILSEIRGKFGKMIVSLSTLLTINNYKFEEYDLTPIIGITNE